MATDSHEDSKSDQLSDDIWSLLSDANDDPETVFNFASPDSSDTLSISALFSDTASSDEEFVNETDYIEEGSIERGTEGSTHLKAEQCSSRQLLSTSEVVETLSNELLFRNDCFEVRPFSLSGVGGFARRDLVPGEVVLLEQPVLRSNYDTLFQDFESLDADARNVFLQLYASDHFEPKRLAIEAIWSTNCFSIDGDCQGLFAIGSRFNHACSPAQNLEYQFDPAAGCMTFTVGAKPIKSGDELTISYGLGLRPIDLYHNYGFRCLCGACAGLTDEEIARNSIW